MKSLPAKPTDLVIRPAHLGLVLNCEHRTISAKLLSGEIPQPDARGRCGLKLWRLSTIRVWNPEIADALEKLLAIPAFAPRPQRPAPTPLLAA